MNPKNFTKCYSRWFLSRSLLFNWINNIFFLLSIIT